MMSRAAVYRIFRRPGDPASPVRPMVIALVLVTLAIVSIGVLRVTRQHEVLALGYRLARESEHVRELQEQRAASSSSSAPRSPRPIGSAGSRSRSAWRRSRPIASGS